MRYLKLLVIPLFLVLASLVPTLVKVQGQPPGNVGSLLSRVEALEAKLANVSVEDDTINGLTGPHFIFEGVNVHIRSGSGSTDDFTFFPETFIPSADLLGLGNLVMGYNEDGVLFGFPVTDRTGSGSPGSHNLIMGSKHNYTSFGGIVTGFSNNISGVFSSVLVGLFNTASGLWSSVSGGATNVASEEGSSVSGGGNNLASGNDSSVSGGQFNTASGDVSSVSGGGGRTASGDTDWVAGSLSEDF